LIDCEKEKKEKKKVDQIRTSCAQRTFREPKPQSPKAMVLIEESEVHDSPIKVCFKRSSWGVHQKIIIILGQHTQTFFLFISKGFGVGGG